MQFKVSRKFDQCTLHQKSKSLQVLDLSFSWSLTSNLELIQLIFSTCIELKEVNLDGKYSSEKCIFFLVSSITENIEKLSLRDMNLRDEHVKILVERCKKLNTLCIESTMFSNRITNDSLTNIIENLKYSLEEPSVQIDKIKIQSISVEKLCELKAMKK